jgi:hypothetical protein
VSAAARPAYTEAGVPAEPTASPEGFVDDATALEEARLLHTPSKYEPPAPEPEPRRVPEERSNHQNSNIGGPSFLGLNDTPGEEYSYLYQDEDRGGGGWVRGILALLVLGAGAVLLSMYWSDVRQWLVNRAALVQQQASNQPPATATSDPAPAQNAEAQAAADATAAQESSELQNSEAGSADPKIEAPQEDTSGADDKTEAGAPAETPAAADSSAKPPAEQPSATAEEPAATAQAQTAEAKPAEPSPAESSVQESGAEKQTLASRRASPPEPVTPAGEELVAAGERYLYGRGVPRNCNQALVYFRSAADQQNARALTRMGALYATGTCVAQNRVMAYNWFSRALAQDRGNHLIEKNLNMLWRDMSGEERQRILRGNR